MTAPISTTLNQTSLRIVRDNNTLNRTPVHQVAKELNITVNTLRIRYTGLAVMCGDDTVDNLVEDYTRRGLTPKQIANILRQGV